MKKTKKAITLSGKSKGFTLIELVVVMAIIAVLAMLIVAAITAARRQAVDTQRTGNAKTIEVALEAFASKNGGRYPGPQTITALHTLLRGTTLGGPYLNQNVSVTTTDFAYVATTGTTSERYGLAVCSNGNTTAPTITLATQTVTGCTGSSVLYRTFR